MKKHILLFFFFSIISYTQMELSAADDWWIKGPSRVCQNTSGHVFYLEQIYGSCTWSVPTGAYIESGANTRMITVAFGPTAVTGGVTVYTTTENGNQVMSSTLVYVDRMPEVPTIDPTGPLIINGGETIDLSIDAQTDVNYCWFETSDEKTLQEVQGASITTATTAWQCITSGINQDRYVAYSDGDMNGKATVLKFDGTNWSTVGSGLSNGIASHIDVKTNKWGNPYLAYSDAYNSGKATVKWFNGTSWAARGADGFTPGKAEYLDLEFPNSGYPYLAFRDVTLPKSKNHVMKYNGAAWETIGTAGFIKSGVDLTYKCQRLAIGPDDQLYFGAIDEVSGENVVDIYKYNGSDWEYIDIPQANQMKNCSALSLAIGSDSKIYIGVYRYDQAVGASVYRLDGQSWTALTNGPFPGTDPAYLDLKFNGNDELFFLHNRADNDSTITSISKFNGSTFEKLPSEIKTAGIATFQQLDFDLYEEPWTAFMDDGSGGKTRVFENKYPCGSSDTTFTANTTGTYAVNITDTDKGCRIRSENEVQLTVVYPMVAGSISDDQQICSNQLPDTLRASAPSGGLAPISYQWQQSTDSTNFTDILSGTNLNYQPAALTSTTYFRLIQTSSGEYGSDTTNAVTITVYPEFTVGSISEDQNICYNTIPSELIGVVPGGGNSPYTYQWQSSTDNSTFTNISGATDIDYQPNALTNTTYYHLIQTSASGCGFDTTNKITITVYPEFVIGSISADQSICYNTTPAELTGVAPTGGDTPYTYQWQSSVDSTTFSNINDATNLNYQPPALTTTTYYRLLQSSASGCGTLTTNISTIRVYPEIVFGSISDDQSICYNTIPDEFIGLAPTGGDGNFSYQWQESLDNVTFTDIQAATNLNYQAGALTDTTYYQLIQTSTFGCGDYTTNKIRVAVYPDFVVGSISDSQSICYNETPTELIGVAPTNGNTPYTYQWQSSTDNITFTNITGATSLDYQAGALTTTTYYQLLQSSASGCGSLATNKVTINVYPEFVVGSISGFQVLYYGQLPEKFIGVAPIGGSPPYVYQWQKSSDGTNFTNILGATNLDYQAPRLYKTTFYRLKQSSNSTCGAEFTNKLSIVVYPEFRVGSIEEDQQIIQYTAPSKLIGIAPSGGRHPYSYQWQNSSDGITFEDIEGATDLDYQPPVLSTTTYYRLVQSAADGFGTATTNIVSVIVYPEFVVGSISEDQIVCSNTAPEILVGIEPSGGIKPYTYQWQNSIDGMNFMEIEAAMDLVYQPPVLSEKTYYRLIQISSGEVGSLTTNIVEIEHHPLPIANIDVDESIICTIEDYQLSATAENYETVHWTSSGDGNFNNPTILNPIYTPGINDVAFGNVKLTLTAISESNCNENDSDDMILSFYSPPLVNAGNDLTVMEGTQIQLNASVAGIGDYSYLWSPTNMLSDPTILNPTTNPIIQTTTFTLQVTDLKSGCITEDKVLIKIDTGITYKISGRVHSIGLKHTMPDTKVYFTGIDKETTTDILGKFSIQVPAGYSGWAIPSRAGYVFEPDSIAFNYVGEDMADQDYGGTLYLRALASPDSIIAGQSVQLSVEMSALYSPIIVCSWQDETGEFCTDEIATVEPTQSTVYTVFVSDAYESTFDTVRVYVSITTGMDDLKMDEGLISLYPNPTKNIINLKISAELDAELISIVNPNGTLVRQIKLPKTVNDHQIQINLEHLVDGTYYLIITNSKGSKISSKKVVKI